MPDAYGNFKGIAVPELPWLKRKREANERQLARQRSAAAGKHNRNRDNGANHA